MMIKTIIAAAVALSLTGCGTLGGHFRELADLGPQDPTVSVTELKKQERIAEPATGALTVAVYNFRDLTGQRKASNTLASLSQQ